MSTIRRQSIISSIVVYFGFALGFVNTYLFTREGSGFTQAEYGLIGAFISIANIMASFAGLGMTAYVNKFFPYYKDNLEPSKNDMMSWSLLISIVGFILVASGGWIFKELVIRKFGTNAPDLVTYYKWVFPFGFGLTFFLLFEAYSWHLGKSVLVNFLREVLFRLFTTLLIILLGIGLIKDFDLFIKIYSFTYILLFITLFLLLWKAGNVHFHFKVSHVTRRFKKKILLLVSFVWGGTLVYTISNTFDNIVIASVLKDGLALGGIYTLAQNIASLIQAPQRGIISSSIGALSQAWKDKDMKKINTIYHRSSINQMIFSIGMFVLIWINFIDGVFTFHLQKEFIASQQVFLFIGLMRIVDMGTGVNAQIIATSIYWRFEFLSGIVLILITLPLNYFLTKQLGVTGPAIANLISFTIYNLIRFIFLYRKYELQPFNVKSLFIILLGLVGYFVSYYAFKDQQGFWWICLRSTVFLVIYVTGTIALNISPDIRPVLQTAFKKIGVKAKS